MSGRHLRPVGNSGRPDRPMSCTEAQKVLLLGGSSTQVNRANSHSETCAECDSGLLASPLPAVPQADVRLRLVLGIMVVAQAILAGPWILGFDPWGLTAVDQAHLTRDGAVGLSAAAAGALTIYRPRYAQPSFVLASVSLVLQAATSLFDRSNEILTAADEAVHICTILLVITLGLVALSIKNSSLRNLSRSKKLPPVVVADGDES